MADEPGSQVESLVKCCEIVQYHPLIPPPDHPSSVRGSHRPLVNRDAMDRKHPLVVH